MKMLCYNFTLVHGSHRRLKSPGISLGFAINIFRYNHTIMRGSEAWRMFKPQVVLPTTAMKTLRHNRTMSCGFEAQRMLPGIATKTLRFNHTIACGSDDGSFLKPSGVLPGTSMKGTAMKLFRYNCQPSSVPAGNAQRSSLGFHSEADNNHTVVCGSEAWRLLNGLVCIYKPPGVLPGTAMHMLRSNLSRTLNQMEQSDLSIGEEEDFIRIEVKKDEDVQLSFQANENQGIVQDPKYLPFDSHNSSGNLSRTENNLVVDTDGLNKHLSKSKVETITSFVDYSSHPLVLGPGFEEDDIDTYCANIVETRASGVMVVGVNEGVRDAKALRRSKPLTTFQIWAEWGRATDTGFKDGRTVAKSTWKHIGFQPWLLDQALSNIQASHQRQAWRSAVSNLQSQEAYELAAQGPVRPANPSDTIIYSIKCLDWKPPEFMLEVKCIADDLYFIMDLISEIGVKVKTNATCTKVRVSQVAMFNADHCLLRKHWRLQHVLDNMSDCRRIVKAFGGIKKSPNFKREGQAENVGEADSIEEDLVKAKTRKDKIIV